MNLERVAPRWSGPCIVAATGPSLTPEVAEECRGHKLIAVNDAYKLLPFADVLFACDSKWWRVHKGCPDFKGEKWSTQGTEKRRNGTFRDDKQAEARDYGLNLIGGKSGDVFSLDPSCIHYGGNSGFMTTNLAILWGGNPTILVGFDMRAVDGKTHYFGEHQAGLHRVGNFKRWIERFDNAAAKLPKHIRIINATEGSSLDCFPKMSLSEALKCKAENSIDA